MITGLQIQVNGFITLGWTTSDYLPYIVPAINENYLAAYLSDVDYVCGILSRTGDVFFRIENGI